MPAWLSNFEPAEPPPASEFQRRRLAAEQSPYQPLAPIAVAVVLGMALDRWRPLGAGWWAVASVAIALWLCGGRLGRRRRPWSLVANGCLLLAVLAVAALWHHACWRLFDADDLGRFATRRAEPVCVEAVAVDTPRRRASPRPSPLRAIPQGEKTVVRLRIVRLRDGAGWRTASGHTQLVVDGHLLGVHAGDRLRVFAQLRAPGEPRNPGEFDYAADARADRRLALLRCESPDCVERLGAGPTDAHAGATGLLTRIVGGVRRAVGDARAASERMLWRRLGPQRAPVAAAMLIGARQGVPRDRSERFRRTGTLHVLVVSGLHVGLVVGLIYAASRVGLFPRRLTLLAVMAAIAAYAVLTGARPPVVRAAVLAEVMCLAAIGGRPVLAMNSLAAAALVVLAWNPAELFRSGPQLSFIAAATLIWFAGRRPTRRSTDPMKRLLAAADGWPVRAAKATARWAGLVLLATLLVWCVTAPLLLTRFHLLSPIAVPISVAVFPLVSIAVTSGVLLLLAGVLCPPLASPLAWCCGLSLDGLQALVEAAEAAPGATWWFGGPSAWWTIGAYALLAAGLLGATTRPRAIRWTQLALVWVIVGFLAAAAGDQRPRGVRCTFIAVGHGCSVLVESPGGGVVLYDAGSLGPPEAGAETIAGVLWSLGVHRIDAIVLSHADVDHYNAAPGLIERFAVGGLYVSPVMFDATDRAEGSRTGPAALLRAARTAGVPVHTLGQGDRLLVDDVGLLVLHPTVDDALLADNAKSMVVAVEHQGRRVLLPGDLEGEGLESLLLQQPYDCDLLLAPHHGSIRSGPPGFAAWSTPEWVVVSGGDAAAAASAGESYARSGATVTHTAEAGMVQFELGAEFCCQRWFSEGLRPVRLE